MKENTLIATACKIKIQKMKRDEKYSFFEGVMKNVLRENEQKGLIFVSVIVTHLHIFLEKILVMFVCVTRMNGSK